MVIYASVLSTCKRLFEPFVVLMNFNKFEIYQQPKTASCLVLWVGLSNKTENLDPM